VLQFTPQGVTCDLNLFYTVLPRLLFIYFTVCCWLHFKAVTFPNIIWLIWSSHTFMCGFLNSGSWQKWVKDA